MNAKTEVTLEQVHSAIVERIKAAFPALKTVEAYRQDRKSLLVPACLVNLMEMEVEPEDDPGTEQLAVTAHFEAVLVIHFRQGDKNPKLEIRKLAAAVAQFVHRQRWGLPVSPAVVEAISEDGFDPELDQFEAWRVEWRQVLHLGESCWDGEGIIPQRIFLGIAPNIGKAHEQDYFEVTKDERLLQRRE